MVYGDCATQSKNKVITAEENKRKFSINNTSGKVVRKVKVDGCLFNNADLTKRCDYLFEIEEPDSQLICLVIYLELKGCDIEKAYQQLLATVNQFTTEHRKIKKECHIVASRVPKAGPKIQQLKVKFKKETAATLIVSTDKQFINI